MNVAGKVQSCLLLCCIVLVTTAPASAATFGELLARAKAEAAAGRNWGPPGDNVADTTLSMMDLIPTATPEQLADLLALLHTPKAIPDAAKADAAPVDGFIDRAGREPDRAVPGEKAAAAAPPSARTTSETPAAAVLDWPRPGPPIVTRGAGDPATVNTVRINPPGPHAAALSQRGREAELRGDISGARRFYASAAEQGDAAAALNCGRLYDPGFIERNTVGGIDANPALARLWYERAAALGNAEVRPLLEALSVR